MTTPTTGRYAPTAWGKSFEELTCPSGQLCLVRKLQPADLTSGILGGTDILAEMVNQEIQEAQRGPQDHKKSQKQTEQEILQKVGEALKDKDGLDSMVDSVVCKAVVEPHIEPVPKEFTDRKIGVVYVDSISFTDKMHVFNFAMQGLDKVKSFRGEPAADVEAVEDRHGVSRPS